MKVIFLDIDGVLNFASCEARAPGGFIGISEARVKLLRQIVDATGARIVLTSTWKMEWSKDDEECTANGLYLTKKLRRHGLHILDKTKEASPSMRGKGINDWLKKNDHVTDWIVLDDDIFPDYEAEGIMPHLIKTSFSNGGMNENDAAKAIELLGGK